MRPRRTEAPTSGLPTELAAGPLTDAWMQPGTTYAEARRRWVMAGREWSQANGLGVSGWLELVPVGVVQFRRSPVDQPSLGEVRQRVHDSGLWTAQ